MFLVEERHSGSKHLQLVSGLTPWRYWLANYVWDMVSSNFFELITLFAYTIFLELLSNFGSIRDTRILVEWMCTIHWFDSYNSRAIIITNTLRVWFSFLKCKIYSII